MMEGLKVKCTNCGRTDFITTAKYDPNVSPRGDMLKCTLPYHIDFLLTSTTGVSSLECPECLAQLAPSGRLVVVPEPSAGPPDEPEPTQEAAGVEDQAEAEVVPRPNHQGKDHQRSIGENLAAPRRRNRAG